MNIEKIIIKNFRNIKEADVHPGEKINFIIGDNAQGKTNFIEAIYTSALLKSFRTRNTIDLIKCDEKVANINIEILNNNSINKVNLNISNNFKTLKLNDKKPDSKQLYSYLNVIVFHPDEVNYISNYPLFRRNLLDRSIFYTKNNYIDIYKKYSRCLKQRNSYLKGSQSDNDCWKEQLIKYGAEIIRERLAYIDKINYFFASESFQKANQENYSLSYSKEFSSRENIEEELKEDFERRKIREKAVGYTLTGPHKDDIVFYLNGQQADKFCSQGQKRSLVISFKTAQILDYQAVHGYSPILILDHMASELDANRKNILLDNLLINSGQVFITSTDLKQIKCSEQSKVFRVKHGEISLAD